MNAINAKMNLIEWSLLLLLAGIWGSSFFFMELILIDLSPMQLVFYRLCMGALFLWVIVFAQQLAKRSYLKHWKEFIILGMINNALPFSMIALAQTTITSSLASILNATVPFFAALFAYMMLPDEKLSPLKFLGLVIGFIGVIVIIGVDAFSGFNDAHQAMLLMIVATISYGLGIVYGRRFKQYNVRPMFLATMQVTTAAMCLMLVIIIRGESFGFSASSDSLYVSMFILAIACTGLAYVIFFYILETAGAVNVSLVTFLAPIVAISLGIIVLDEVLLLNHIIGFVIIFCGLVVIDGRMIAFNTKRYL